MESSEPPILTQELCDHYLHLLRNNLIHRLDSEACYEIFKSFGASSVAEEVKPESNNDSKDWYYKPVILSLADRAYGWLSIITARKVLPVWEQYGTGEVGDEDYSHDSVAMLEMAEKFLLGLAVTSTVKIDLCNRFHFGVIGVVNRTNKKGYLANDAAYRALEAVVVGIEDFTAANCVMSAASAYCILDPNEPGLWWEAYMVEEEDKMLAELTEQGKFEEIERHLKFMEDKAIKEIIEKRVVNVKKFVPVTIDVEKELEFWEWWLTAAIPQAWKQAERTLVKNAAEALDKFSNK